MRTGPYLTRRTFFRGSAAISASAWLPLRAKEFGSPSVEYVGTVESIDVFRTAAGHKRKPASGKSKSDDQ